jgi:hypothetical protein
MRDGFLTRSLDATGIEDVAGFRLRTLWPKKAVPLSMDGKTRLHAYENA